MMYGKRFQFSFIEFILLQFLYINVKFLYINILIFVSKRLCCVKFKLVVNVIYTAYKRVLIVTCGVHLERM
jgi:hypothetical protein